MINLHMFLYYLMLNYNFIGINHKTLFIFTDS